MTDESTSTSDNLSLGMAKALIFLELANLKAMCSLAQVRIASHRPTDSARLIALTTSLQQAKDSLTQYMLDSRSHTTPT